MGHNTTVLTWNFPLLHPGLVDCVLKAALHPPPEIPYLSAVYLRISSVSLEPAVDCPLHEPHFLPTTEEMHLQLHFSTLPSSITAQDSKDVCHNTDKTVSNQKSCGQNCCRHTQSCPTSHPNHSAVFPRKLSSFLLWTCSLFLSGHLSMGETQKT